MIELHLIGYTSDLRYLVLDLEPDGERGRYRLVVDGDLLLTLDELRDLRAHAGMDVGVPYERLEERYGLTIARSGTEPAEDEHEAPSAGEPRSSETPHRTPDGRVPPDRPVTARPPTSQPPALPPTEDGPPPTFRLVEVPDEPPPEEAPREEQPGEAPEEPSDERGEDDEGVTGERVPDEGSTVDEEPDEEPEDRSAPEEREVRERDEAAGEDETIARSTVVQEAGSPSRDDRSPLGRDSELSPAQIQARLRAGRRPESVAEEAGTDVAWVERWLPPILTERAQVLQEAQALHLERPRKGPSRAPLGEAVAANLRRRHLDPDEDADWSVKRRASGRWSINVRYRYRNKSRSATWALDREEGELTASSKAARELGWTDER